MAQLEYDMRDKGDTFISRPDFIFSTQASFEFANLDPENMPGEDCSLDPVILAGSTAVLTRNEDMGEIYSISFVSFKKTIRDVFNQDIQFTTAPYHQMLVLKKGLFEFISTSDNGTYLARKNADLTNIFEKLQVILNQERQFHEKMYSFILILEENKLFNTMSTTMLEKSRNTTHIRDKRSLLDIFSGYSISDIASIAQKNYATMNSNFHNINHFEKRMHHSQRKLSNEFGTLSALQRKEAQVLFTMQVNNYLNNLNKHFVEQLDSVIQNNVLPLAVTAVFTLINEQTFCSNLQCYVNPIYKISNQTLSVTVQMQQQHLQQAFYVSCSLLSSTRTSKFSHKIAVLNNTNLIFQDKTLPTIDLEFLQNPQIDIATRAVLQADLISSLIYPIYKDSSVSLQCLKPGIIEVDGNKMHCDSSTLHFIPLPETISIEGVPILTTILSHYLAQRITTKMESFFYDNEMFISKNISTHTFDDQVETFFLTASPLHFSILASLGTILFLVTILFCIITYLKVPQLLVRCLCCFSSDCFLRKLALTKYDIMTQSETLSQEMAASAPVAPTAPEAPTAPPTGSLLRDFHPVPLEGMCYDGIPGCGCRADASQHQGLS